MQTELCKKLGIEYPIFAFTHCRDVVAAVSNTGVWAGTLSLTTTESDCPPEQKQTYIDSTSRDTVRSRAWTGKPCRVLTNDWTNAWDSDNTPDPLGMPLQFMVTSEAVVRGHMYASQSQKVNFNPCGQIVGSTNVIKPVRLVIQEMIEEYLDAVERLNDLLPQ